MVDKPLVSICIPTYNRSVQLKKTIESIVKQPEFISGKAEIVISDNASEDNTEFVGREYAEKYENILYFRNAENIRDKNFPLVLSRANGVLRKLNNDTFILKSDALKKLCIIAEKYNTDKPYIFLSNGQREIYDEELMNFRSFVVTESFWVTRIASFTIWGSECDNIASDIDGCELLLWQVRKIYELIYKKNCAVVCDQKIGYSISPPKKDISYGLYQIFYLNFMQLLKPYVNNKTLDVEDIEIIEKDLLFNFFTNWIIQWELKNANLCYSETENLKESVFEQYKNKKYWNKYVRYYFFQYCKKRLKIQIEKFLGK